MRNLWRYSVILEQCDCLRMSSVMLKLNTSRENIFMLSLFAFPFPFLCLSIWLSFFNHWQAWILVSPQAFFHSHRHTSKKSKSLCCPEAECNINGWTDKLMDRHDTWKVFQRDGVRSVLSYLLWFSAHALEALCYLLEA